MKELKQLRERQEAIFGAIATILGGISSPVRINLIHFLSQGPLTVEVLASKIDQSVANTSMHLRKMLAVGIVTVTVQGKNRLYALHPAALSFWESCQDFAQSIDPKLKLEVDDIYEEISWSENLKTTIKMAKNNEIVLLDARPKEEVSETLKGINVINIPSTEISKNLSKLPKKKPVLVFCRGRLCALSSFVVNELRKNGINAYRLDESWYSLKKLIS
ncbi:MAG TPA: helix-turn-helix domain-containing protein [Bacteriovoracaceae bacterium]|nr:helix-turn-helix domain-containing protein [Bacteriovoracaceae bacterium]